MGSKTKTLFEVTFWARKRVKAFTHEEARGIVEGMENIKLINGIDSKVTANTKLDCFREGMVIHIPAIITGFVGIMWAITFFNLVSYISDFPDEYVRVIGLICLLTLFLVTYRIPNTVGRWFRSKEY